VVQEHADKKVARASVAKGIAQIFRPLACKDNIFILKNLKKKGKKEKGGKGDGRKTFNFTRLI